ncbi:MAG: Kae1-associated serine/threonine protein kinase [Nitrosopumilales archaeon]|nr:Kae1-associated serine/threonine protein kinase [Nitrosopumilales archaeon]
MLMKLIKKGAEGDLYLITWNKQKSILKIRKKKAYRNPLLDEKIRRQRTIREAQIIVEAKSFGIDIPLIYLVDIKNCSIVMQYIEGTLVRDLSDSKLVRCCNKIGRIVGTLHKNGIMHGDLTTSNFILSKNKLVTIDFGLANKTCKPEDHAVDLRLLKEILGSAHVHIMKKTWASFLSGYKTIVGPTKLAQVTNLVSIIESRGRYATVV